MKLGLGIGELNAEGNVELAKEFGIKGLMLGGWQFESGEAVKPFVERISADGMEICQWGAWDVNAMAPTDEAVSGACKNIRLAGEIGAPTAVTHGGGANADHMYVGCPENFTADAVKKVAETFKVLGKAAEEAGTTLVLEPHFATVLNSWEVCAEVLDAVGCDSVKIQFDPANMVRYDDYFNTAPLLELGFEVLHGRIGSAHAKDIRMENKLHLHMCECPAGDGCLDYATYVKLLEKELGPDGYLIIEHTPADRVGDVVEFIDKAAASSGVTIVR
jgi:sugar phosphate isomerase/epimerase